MKLAIKREYVSSDAAEWKLNLKLVPSEDQVRVVETFNLSYTTVYDSVETRSVTIGKLIDGMQFSFKSASAAMRYENEIVTSVRSMKALFSFLESMGLESTIEI